MKKLLFLLGILVLGNLQYSIIFKNNNISDFFFLNQQNNKLLEDIQKISIKNTILDNEIKDLSSSTHALENFARYNLGLVKKDETFVQVIKNEQ
jgi:cell division protein FtsB